MHLEEVALTVQAHLVKIGSHFRRQRREAYSDRLANVVQRAATAIDKNTNMLEFF